MSELSKFTPFVGRETELRYLHQAFNAMIEQKTPKFVLIEGDFGVGKTALVNHFLEQVARVNPAILIGQGFCVSETEMSGLTPFHQLLASLLKQDGSQKSIVADWREFLEKVAPAWLDMLPGTAAQTFEAGGKFSGHSSYRQENVFVQFTNALMQLAEKQPLLAFLDDLQWADASSLALLTHLARSLQDRPILFVCAYRPEAKETSLNAERFNEFRVKTLRYDTSRELKIRQGIDAAEYINQRYPRHAFAPEMIRQIQQMTDGHPLFLSQLFSLGQETGVIVEVPETDGNAVWKLSAAAEVELTIPTSIQAVLEQRLRLMGDDLRKIAISASVEGEEFTAQVVAHLSKLEEEDVYDQLEKLQIRYWLIQEQETKALGETALDMYRFMHRFFRDYIYDQLSDGKRRNLHRAVGEYLEQLYGGVEMTPPLTTTAAVTPEEQRQMQRLRQQITDLQERWDLLTQKIQRLEKEKIIKADAEKTFELEQRIAELTTDRQQLEQQLTELETQLPGETSPNQVEQNPESNRKLYPIAGQLALHFREARQPKKAAKYALLAAQFEQSRYAWAEGEEWCEFGLSLLENVSPDAKINQLRLDLLKLSGDGYSNWGKILQADKCYRSALVLAQKMQVKPEQIVELCIELADVCEEENCLDEAIKFVKQGQSILSEHEQTIPYSELHVKLRWSYVEAQYRLGKNELVAEFVPKLLSETAKLPQTVTVEYVMSRTYNLLANVLGDLGRYDEVMVNYQKALELAEKIGDKRSVVIFLTSKTWTYFYLDKFEEGINLVSRAIELASQIGDLNHMSSAKVAKGSLFLSMGKTVEALKELDEAHSILAQINAQFIISWLYAQIALVHLALGDLEKSFQYAIDSLSEAEKSKQPEEISNALDTLGQVEVALQDWISANQHFNQAISVHDQAGHRHYAARTRCHFADALLRQGQPAAAETLVRQAAAVFQELKLEHEIKKAEELLEKCNP